MKLLANGSLYRGVEWEDPELKRNRMKYWCGAVMNCEDVFDGTKDLVSEIMWLQNVGNREMELFTNNARDTRF